MTASDPISGDYQAATGFVETGSFGSLVPSISLSFGAGINLRGEGETILKYGHDIGKTVSAIVKGNHVHTHNLKTKKW